MALFFEFINGFHDTANAVATVIYTRSLPAGGAVIWSGIWEFYWGTLIHRDSCLQRGRNPSSVAGAQCGFRNRSRRLLALLLASVIWNSGTWYLGMPCSSSHALIGSILGVSVADSWLHSGSAEGLRWDQIREVLLGLLLSPTRQSHASTSAKSSCRNFFGISRVEESRSQNRRKSRLTRKCPS